MTQLAPTSPTSPAAGAGAGADSTSTAAASGRLTATSPLGRIVVESDGSAITRLEIEREGRLSTDGLDDVADDLTTTALAQLEQYFAGDRQSFDLPVRLDGTPFQQSIWRALGEIPFGTVRSYGELGRATGRPTAGRAVGGAVGANPVPLLVPCHRVLASDQRITGYSAGDGVPTKIWLLDHEGIPHR